MEMFAYIKTESDITISFGYQYINARIYGYRKGCEGKVFLGNVKQDSRITMPISVFNNFDGFQFDDKKIELKKEM